MQPVRSALAVAAGYLLGTIPSADVAGKIVGISVRTQGTGNPGAINASVLLGKRWGTAVAGVDIGKGWVAGALGQRVSPATAHAAAAAAVFGHVFPLWSGFKGGKGVATSYGAVLGAFPAYAIPDLLIAGTIAKAVQQPRLANDLSSVAWTAAALLWWRKQMPTLWGPAPTVALPLSAAATSGLLAWRFRQPERVSGGARLGDPKP
jgi:glycerol-3-phosphate acyltransferase PlsY